ncbi:MAG: hypothetical protein EXR49_01920 [Dehalococcoidia bacterium]|nr:hypothetical protein [Dehalococcoidia bacterium]
MSEAKDKVQGYNGHAYFSIDDIAAMLPGPARLMHEIGTRWWKIYYASQETNWPLAEYEIKEMEELFEICMVTRPKYVQWMEPFLHQDVKAVKDAVKKKDWKGFEAAYHLATKNANDYHKAANKPLIHWKLPAMPPPDMEMKPLA